MWHNFGANKYLDKLGMASKYNTKVFCMQTLIGGNYGLLDTKTFLPILITQARLTFVKKIVGGRCDVFQNVAHMC